MRRLVIFVAFVMMAQWAFAQCAANCNLTTANTSTNNSAFTITNTVSGWPSVPSAWAAYANNVFGYYLQGGWDGDSSSGEAGAADINDSLTANTPGIFNSIQTNTQCNSPADCIPLISRFYGVGVSAGQDEGPNVHLHGGETGYVFLGTLNSPPTCGVTCNFSVTQTQGATAPNGDVQLGSNMFLIDPARSNSAGYTTGWSGSTFTGSGTKWNSTNGASCISTTTTDLIPTRNTPLTSMTVTLMSTFGCPGISGTQLACFANNSGDIKFQCSHVTAASGSGSV